MAVLMSCPGCLKRLRASEELAGRRVKCSRCGLKFVAALDGLPTAAEPAEDHPPIHPGDAGEQGRDGEPLDMIVMELDPPDNPQRRSAAIGLLGPKVLGGAALAAVMAIVAIAAWVRLGPFRTHDEAKGAPSIAGEKIEGREVDGRWTATDPDGDCRIDPQDKTVAFVVPGTFHDLTCMSGIAPASGKRNAPRATKPVSGEFVAEATIQGDFRPTGAATGLGVPYHGVGLLLWIDADNFIRLERCAVRRGQTVEGYINFALCRQSWVEQVETGPLPSGTVALRLEKKGQEIIGSARGDTGPWVRVASFFVAWPHDASVGAAAINSSTTPLECRVEDLSIREP